MNPPAIRQQLHTLLDERQQEREAGDARRGGQTARANARGQLVVRVVKIMQAERDLLHVVRTTHPPRGFAGRLHCGKQQGDEYADDGNHYQ